VNRLENVFELSGQKKRVVQNENGQIVLIFFFVNWYISNISFFINEIHCVSRAEDGIPFETPNIREKQTFMNGEKKFSSSPKPPSAYSSEAKVEVSRG